MSEKAQKSTAPVRVRPSAHSGAAESDAIAKMCPMMRLVMRAPRTDGSVVLEPAAAIGHLMEDKCGRISSAGADRGDEGGWNAEHFRFQFISAIQKQYIENISRTESLMVRRT
jgi:hypothetical protein